SGHVWDGNRCGRDLIITEELEPERIVIKRVDINGRIIEQLTQGPRAWSPARTPAGQVWFSRPHAPNPTIRRCDRNGCRDLFHGFAIGLAASPDGKRLTFVDLHKRGASVQWNSAGGGEAHDVAETETSCPVGWASDDTIWVSRRRGRKFVWTEVEADNGRETRRAADRNRETTH